MQARLRGSPTQRSAPGATNTESAQSENSPASQAKSVSRDHSVADAAARIAPAPYSPFDGGGRPCARCHSRTGWRRLESLGGGGGCCGDSPEAQRAAGDLGHQCSPSCLLAAGGAA
jgi:hypothetical protein